MFEAHYLSQADYPTFNASVDPGLTRRVYSHAHQCPLHAWAARGKRKDDHGIAQPHWFLYVEYCRHDGNRDRRLIERPCIEGIDGLFDEIAWLELPGIDPQRTRDWLLNAW